jgi:hypothetical protein
MAQNIEIPVAFEWCPQPATWEIGSAKVTGWALESEQTEPHFLAKVEQHGTSFPLEVPWWAFPLETLRLLREEKAREFRQTYSLELLTCSPVTPRERKREANPWQMREEFLRLKRDTKALLAFLKKWGVWGPTRTLALLRSNSEKPFTNEDHPEWSRLLFPSQFDPKRVPPDILGLVGSDSPESTGLDRKGLNYLFPCEVWTFQEQCRDALRKPVDEWLPTQKLLALIPREQYPHYLLRASNCQTAILNAILIDLLRKVKFRLCARPDCRAPFAIESKHRRDYCSQYCAHLESVRRQRRAEAKKRALQEKGTTYAKR